MNKNSDIVFTPTALNNRAQGCRAKRWLPWVTIKQTIYPEGVEVIDGTPSGYKYYTIVTQGSDSVATLGFDI
jgi:hypothetical protein